MRASLLTTATLAALLCAAACAQIDGFKDFSGDGAALSTGGASGAGTTGSNAGSATSTGGASGAGTTGGAGATDMGGASGAAGDDSAGSAGSAGDGGSGGDAIGGTSGASSGSGGAAGSGGMPVVCADATPTTKDGRPMVEVPEGASGTCVWIDANEVSRDDYAAFTSDSATKLQADVCMGMNPDLGPDATCMASATTTGTAGKNPVVCVDWCDAAAYCLWAGKSLCQGSHDAVSDPDHSAWLSACSDDAGWSYPYGSDFSDMTCNVLPDDGTPLGTAPVGAFPDCQTHAPGGIFDLVGNASEWVDECASETGLDDSCHVRGGSYASMGPQATCDAPISLKRSAAQPVLGFRCCLAP